MSKPNPISQSGIKIILETAVSFLAGKHNVTTAEIIAAMKDGNEKVWNQINELIEAGYEAAKTA